MEVFRIINKEVYDCDIALALEALGTIFENIHKYEKAEKLYRETLKIRKLKYGEFHMSVSCSYQNLGSLYAAEGKLDESMQLYEKSLEINKRVFGENHVDTAESYRTLGAINLIKGNFEKAEQFLNKSYDLFRRLPAGENGKNYILLLDNFCNLYNNKKNLSKLEEFSEKFAEKAIEFYGPSLIYLKKIAFNAIHRPHTQSQFLKFYLKLYDLNLKSGEITTAYLLFYAQLSRISKSTDLNKFSHGLIQMGKNSGENSKTAGECFIYYGDQLLLDNNQNTAKKVFLKAYNITKFNSEDNDDKVIYAHLNKLMLNINKEFVEEKILNKAEKCFLQIYQLYHDNDQRNFCDKNYNYLITLNALGVLYEKKNRFHKAEEFYFQGYMVAAINQKEFPEKIAAIAANLSRIYNRLMDIEKELYYHQIYLRLSSGSRLRNNFAN